MKVLHRIVKKVLPNGQLKKRLWDLYIFILIKYIPYRYRKLVKKAGRKEKIKVAFLIHSASVWKYDYLFKLLLHDHRFDPVIIVCPVINYDNDTMFKEIKLAIDFFSKRNYPTINTWNKNLQKWIDIKVFVKPDIVFFPHPWASLSRPEYYIYNFLDTLTCYVPYGYKTSHLHQANFNQPFQNLLWKIFYETEIHKNLASEYSRNKGKNGLVTGYPGMDNLCDKKYMPVDVWKTVKKDLKKVIWAPHHTIFGKSDCNLGFSTFLRYYDFMLSLADEFKDKIQISLKPHPLLRPKLYNHPDWGKERTDNYFEKWASMSNAQVEECDYTDLFLTSDAMINDGESFMVEYLYTKKPAMFLVADERVADRFNVVGKMTFEQLYQGRSERDIINFINNVVIDGNDYKKESRVVFFENLVKPPNNKLASENIFDFLQNIFLQLKL